MALAVITLALVAGILLSFRNRQVAVALDRVSRRVCGAHASSVTIRWFSITVLTFVVAAIFVVLYSATG